MRENNAAIEIANLSRRYGHTEAVCGLNLTVQPGRCYGFFGRNGAGKTTTIKCILGHLRPTTGSVRVFGLDPQRDEVGVKRHIGYVPEQMGFYPWMTAQAMLDYAASFRPRTWNKKLEFELMGRFGLDPKKKIKAMSKGMRAQLALICAIAAEPDLLLLDEPTSGLDPIVRREFIQTVIGAFQETDPERRTVFVSTHLISEWEGMIDEFTMLDEGHAVITMEADTARERFRKIRMRFHGEPPRLELFDGIHSIKTQDRALEIITDGWTPDLAARLQELYPMDTAEEGLTLEEIFVVLGSRKTAQPQAERVPV